MIDSLLHFSQVMHNKCSFMNEPPMVYSTPTTFYIIHVAVGCVTDCRKSKSVSSDVGVSQYVSPLDHFRPSASRLLLRPALVSINFHLGVLACIVFINREMQKRRTEVTPAHGFLTLASSSFTCPYEIPGLCSSAKKYLKIRSQIWQMWI